MLLETLPCCAPWYWPKPNALVTTNLLPLDAEETERGSSVFPGSAVWLSFFSPLSSLDLCPESLSWIVPSAGRAARACSGHLCKPFQGQEPEQATPPCPPSAVPQRVWSARLILGQDPAAQWAHMPAANRWQSPEWPIQCPLWPTPSQCWAILELLWSWASTGTLGLL